MSQFLKKWGTIAISIAVVIGASSIIKNSIRDVKTMQESVQMSEAVEADHSESSESDNNPRKNEKENSKVNYDNFLSIQMGMTYEEVKDILGDGKEESSNETNGVKTVMYSWKADEYSNLSITIQDDIVINKDQAGLLDMDAQITMDKYNQIQNGMTYNQVQEILGEGQMISETEIMGEKGTIYEYINKDQSKANFIFSSDSLIDKAQLNLK
ncbi:MAG: DUF3862 domain-containing protein [Clostridium sp.]